jgi:hypothetical protein
MGEFVAGRCGISTSQGKNHLTPALSPDELAERGRVKKLKTETLTTEKQGES